MYQKILLLLVFNNFILEYGKIFDPNSTNVEVILPKAVDNSLLSVVMTAGGNNHDSKHNVQCIQDFTSKTAFYFASNYQETPLFHYWIALGY